MGTVRVGARGVRRSGEPGPGRRSPAGPRKGQNPTWDSCYLSASGSPGKAVGAARPRQRQNSRVESIKNAQVWVLGFFGFFFAGQGELFQIIPA